MQSSFSTKSALAMPFLRTTALACGFAIVLGVFNLPASANREQVRQGLPGRRISGGVRSQCFQDATKSFQSLVAITPRNLLGKTAEAHPTFWFSLPETQSTKTINFELFDSADNIVYSNNVEQSHASGLSKVELPPTTKGLTPGENYRWVLDIKCESDPEYSSLEVQGWVRRVEISTDLSSQIASASLAEQAYLYEEAGLWHEQVTALAELRNLQPESIEAQLKWAALIQASGLDSHIPNSPLETTIGVMDSKTARTEP